MRRTTHTPGPWAVEAGNLTAEGGRCILASLHTWDDDAPEEGRANARLLEAAPDMVNALRGLLRHAERVNEVLEQKCGVRFVDTGPLDMARDSLKRAVGDA
jgi:hypothetical protein